VGSTWLASDYAGFVLVDNGEPLKVLEQKRSTHDEAHTLPNEKYSCTYKMGNAGRLANQVREFCNSPSKKQKVLS
jgi:hypothetical protein